MNAKDTSEDLSDRPLIVGTGPAGLEAAATFVNAGWTPVVLDESPTPGGQGTRRLSPPMAPERDRLFPGAIERMLSREAREDAILSRCDYRPGTLVWGAFEDQIETLREGRMSRIRRGSLLLATGAMDRIIPVDGWTLPGVFSLGGAQIALKRDASFIGTTTIFAGSSPLLYLAAVQYLRMGGRVAAVLDTTPLLSKVRAAPAMAWYHFPTFWEGTRLIAELRAANIPIRMGVTLEAILGEDRVRAVRFRDRRERVTSLNCDAVALGYGLRSEAQLAELAGATFAFDESFRQWFPQVDQDGQAGSSLWLAGDGLRIGGAVAAAEAGKLAALSILDEAGYRVNDRERAHLRRAVARWRGFQAAMTDAFAVPQRQLAELSDDTILCRCERVSVGAVRASISQPQGPVEINRIKAVTRCGMGRCQGRLCGSALSEIVSQRTGLDLSKVGRLRTQAPVRPIPISSSMDIDA